MIILASDLDNTLVFSPRRNILGEKVCVEVYKDMENSYMTEKSVEILKRLQEKLLFVPITTRSTGGFSRIDFNLVGIPKYALTCNGGVLLINGEVDEEWYSQSISLIKDSDIMLEKAIDILKKDINLTLDIRKVENLFVFTKSSKIDETVENLKKELDLNLVDILTQGVKIYVMPKILNKGTGVKRLKEKMKPEKIFVAGDTKFDIPMLLLGDKSYFPEELEELFSKKINLSSNLDYMCILKSQGDFSDIFLNDIERIIE